MVCLHITFFSGFVCIYNVHFLRLLMFLFYCSDDFIFIGWPKYFELNVCVCVHAPVRENFNPPEYGK